MCDAFKPWHKGMEVEANPKIAALGYYSLFAISFQNCPAMSLYTRNSQGGFQLSRYTGRDENMNLNISPSNGLDTTWASIQGWLDTCLQTHGRCNEVASTSFIPTRLLQLETVAGQEPSFRMVHVTEVEPATRYATFSHCYSADDDGLQLTASTLARLSAAQTLSVLPLAFRDAFTVVTRVGLTHLWIDRVCVLQDSVADQRTEAGKSRDVFRNAFLSIAANGTSSASGLFVKRDPARVAPTVFDFPINAAGTTVPYHSWLEAPRGWACAFRDDPLSQSARAMQERLPAPRVVHFGSKMVFWECHDSCCAEIHPRSVNEAARGARTPEEVMMQRRNKPWKTLLNAPAWKMQDDSVNQVFTD